MGLFDEIQDKILLTIVYLFEMLQVIKSNAMTLRYGFFVKIAPCDYLTTSLSRIREKISYYVRNLKKKNRNVDT